MRSISGAARVRLRLRAGLLATLGIAACDRHEVPPGFQGVVEFDERLVAADVPGRLTQIEAARGDAVTEGAVLARLDDSEPAMVREVRSAELQAAQAQLDLLLAGSRSEEVRETTAQLASARATVRQVSRNLTRNRKLLEDGVVPPAVVDDLEAELARARANVQVLDQRLRIMRDGARSEEIAAAEARVLAAEAALEREDRHLARYRIAAPISGEVLDILHWPGEVVGAGTPVMRLADTTHPFVDAFVPQGALGELAVGDPAKVRVDALPNPLDGTVENIARTTEFTPRFLFSEQERPNLVIRVRVRIEDPERTLHAGVPAFAVMGPDLSP